MALPYVIVYTFFFTNIANLIINIKSRCTPKSQNFPKIAKKRSIPINGRLRNKNLCLIRLETIIFLNIFENNYFLKQRQSFSLILT